MNATLEPLRKRFAEDPDDLGAFDYLEEHLFMEADWRGLAELYARRQEAPSLSDRPQARAQLALRLGQLYEERLSASDAAIGSYTEAARLDPTLRRALQSLRRIYSERQSWAAVLQIGEQELSLTTPGEERAAMLREMGDLWRDALKDAEQAEHWYERARTEVAAEPAAASPEARSPRIPLPALPTREPEVRPDTAPPRGLRSPPCPPDVPAAPESGRAATTPEAAVPDTRPATTTPEVPDEDPEPLLQRAWNAAARGDRINAERALEQALEENPSDVEALDMWLTLLEGSDQLERQAALLSQRAELADTDESRGVMWVRLGEIEERRNRPDEARQAYEKGLACRPGFQGGVAGLRRLYRAAEAWLPLAEMLEATLVVTEAPAALDLRCELAALYERELRQPELAIEQYQIALELDRDDPRANQGLARLAPPDAPEEEAAPLTMPELDDDPIDDPEPRADERGARIVGVLERKLAAREEAGDETSTEAVHLRLRIAELRANSLGNPMGALEVLEPLRGDPEAMLEAAPVLAGLYEQLGRLEPLMDLAEEAARMAQPAEQRVFWYRRAAEAARALGEAERAIECFRRLLDECPSDRGARFALCDLYRSRGEARPLAQLLRGAIAHADEAHEFELHLELASLMVESLADVEGSVIHLRRCLEIDPEREDLLEWALAASSARGGAHAQLDLIEHVTEKAESARARAALLARRGTLLCDSLDWKKEATQSWRAALALDPDQPVALARLGDAVPA